MADYTAYPSARTQAAAGRPERGALWRNVNKWAIASLLLGLLWLDGLGSALGVVAAVIALRQASANGGAAHAASSRLAVAGLVIGMLGLAVILVLGLARSYSAVTSIGHQHQ